VVGAICSCSGPEANNLALLSKASTAWADSINASGGINGHPVKMITMDDGNSPATALLDAKKLVEQDHIMAMVGDNSLADTGFVAYMTAKGVPVVGGIAVETPFLTSPDFFNAGSPVPIQLVGTMTQAKQAGKKKVGILYCAEVPACKQLVGLAKGAAALAGGIGTYTASISPTSPSYPAPCLAAKGAGVDALFTAENAAVVSRVAAACAQQGYKPVQVNETTTSSKSWLQDPNMNGVLMVSTNAPYTDTSIPAVKAFIDALNKYATGATSSPQFSYDIIYPWIAGKLFEAAAKAGNLTPSSTSADIKKGLYALKAETLDGLAPPLTFTSGKPGFATCYFSSTVKNRAFVSLNGSKSSCLSAAQATALGKALGG
jgi:branched-chain amino acid transport system substrate-binding protein